MPPLLKPLMTSWHCLKRAGFDGDAGVVAGWDGLEIWVAIVTAPKKPIIPQKIFVRAVGTVLLLRRRFALLGAAN